jgi:hypothetical protein
VSRRRRHATSGRCTAFGAVAAAAISIAGCSSTPTRSGEVYCGELALNADALTIDITAGTQVAEVVALAQKLSSLAPVAVMDQWGRLATLIDTAATIDVADDVAKLELVQLAYETAGDARQIARHAQTVCGIDLAVGGLLAVEEAPPPPPPTTASPG